ncbi:MAG: hypothetical protein R3C10_27705 [Pirellulales bacterium]
MSTVPSCEGRAADHRFQVSYIGPMTACTDAACAERRRVNLDGLLAFVVLDDLDEASNGGEPLAKSGLFSEAIRGVLAGRVIPVSS